MSDEFTDQELLPSVSPLSDEFTDQKSLPGVSPLSDEFTKQQLLPSVSPLSDVFTNQQLLPGVSPLSDEFTDQQLLPCVSPLSNEFTDESRCLTAVEDLQHFLNTAGESPRTPEQFCQLVLSNESSLLPALGGVFTSAAASAIREAAPDRPAKRQRSLVGFARQHARIVKAGDTWQLIFSKRCMLVAPPRNCSKRTAVATHCGAGFSEIITVNFAAHATFLILVGAADEEPNVERSTEFVEFQRATETVGAILKTKIEAFLGEIWMEFSARPWAWTKGGNPTKGFAPWLATSQLPAR